MSDAKLTRSDAKTTVKIDITVETQTISMRETKK